MLSMRDYRKNEEGLVAIVVATIIMIILSLITMGFARLMQGEQKQALDRSLSTQAFYAAESAVNDVVRRIQDENPVTRYTSDKTDCRPDATFNGSVNSANAASYSCLLIDQAPDTLEYTQGSIGITTSKVIPLHADTNVQIGSIKVAWEQSAGVTPTFSNSCPTTEPVAFPAFGSWAWTTGMMRLDLIPADTLDRDSLINNTLSLFLYPCTGAGSVTSILYSAHSPTNAKGRVVPVRCASGAVPRDCELTIELDAGAGAKNRLYYLRAKSIYRASDMTIRIYDTASPPNQLAIRGAQVQIDSTGKVNDVVRRVQVRVPVNKAYAVPEFVIETTDSICKQIQVAPAPANIVQGVGPASTCPY